MSSAAIFTAFVCIATMILKVDIPQTRGYFNIGDSMVYVSALLFGPFVGAFAGGIGSMLADVLLGAYQYAPGTLAIKGIEGWLVGYISYKSNPLEKWERLWKMFTVFLSVSLAFTVYTLGSVYYSFEWQFTPLGIHVGTVQINPTVWIIVALLLEAFIIYVGVGLDPKVAWYGLAIIIGGVEMIIGYFLYEFYPLNYGYAALYEIPFNIGQAVVGLALAIPIVKTVRKTIQLPTSST
jgi:uncharacterized membrane protein